MVTQSTIDVKDSQTKQSAKFPEHTYQRTGPKMSLPFLPGNNFTDPTVSIIFLGLILVF